MKESMAGTWIFGIVALFIVLFSSFIAYSISYTKAFKTKNEILNYIEQNEGFTMAKDVDKVPIDRLTNEQMEKSTATDVKAYQLIQSMGYNTATVSCTQYGEEQYGGYCVARICYKDTVSKKSNAKVVYKVTTFIKINIPVVNINLKLPISGETKSLYYENDVSSTYSCWSSTDLD